MCLITLSWQPGPKPSLVIAANRDEFYARPAMPVHHWPGADILAGKDLQAGGTWLGVSAAQASGQARVRFAALTNYRDVKSFKPNAPSRGNITTAFLQGSVGAADYLQSLAESASSYNPFNLLVFDGHDLMGFESRHRRAFALPSGISAVSNADFNTPWPKLVRLQRDFAQALGQMRGQAQLETELFDLLACDDVASDADLPQTGIALQRERALSAAFIRTADYGTRASSVLQISDRLASFTERSFGATGLISTAAERLSLGAR